MPTDAPTPPPSAVDAPIPPPAASDAPCALLARTHGAQLAGTAPVATGWVLVEQPGPWGRTALTSSTLEPALGAHLDEAAGDDVRVQLIRRPGPSNEGRTPRPRTVVLAHAGATPGDAPWVERLELETDAELWDLDPSLAARTEPPGLGTAITGPLWLVCTHGKRDRCCAEHGRPIADALAGLHGDAVWEVSHVGGHRFAGNVVSLPGGEVYGLLGVADALDAAARHLDGRYDVAHLRGRSGLPRPAQAAELLARAHLDLAAHEAVVVQGWSEADAEEVTVWLTADRVPHRVTVRRVPTGVASRQSCDADEEVDPGRFELVELAPGEGWPVPVSRARPPTPGAGRPAGRVWR